MNFIKITDLEYCGLKEKYIPSDDDEEIYINTDKILNINTKIAQQICVVHLENGSHFITYKKDVESLLNNSEECKK